ncbi:MAG: hypothetical protein ACP5LN_01700 [Thermoproteota archaeon]|jgi:hypothetical protein
MLEMEKTSERYDINISLFFFLLGFLLFVSITLIFNGVSEVSSGKTINGIMSFSLGILGFALVAYNINKIRHRLSLPAVLSLGPRVVTVEICENCGYRTERLFKEGDFIFGRGDKCPKCNSETPMLIEGIYLKKEFLVKAQGR